MIIEVIDLLSNKKFQEESWVLGLYFTFISDYSEAINTLGDLDFYNDVRYNLYGLNSIELEIVNDFIKKIFEFKFTDFTIEFLLKNKDWNDVTIQAKNVKDILLHIWK